MAEPEGRIFEQPDGQRAIRSEHRKSSEQNGLRATTSGVGVKMMMA